MTQTTFGGIWRRFRSPRPEVNHVIVLILLSVLLFFVGLGQPSLWEPDEPRYAEACREMAEQGNFLEPRENYEERWAKPILFYWMIFPFQLLFGIQEITSRLPVAFCALLMVLTVYRIGRRFGGSQAALISALILMTSFRILTYARHGLPEVPLLTFGLLALDQWIASLYNEDSRKRHFLLAWLFTALGFLIKGPVVFLIALVPFAALLAIKKQRSYLRSLPWGSAILIFVGVVCPWFIYMTWVHGWKFLEQIGLTENWRRFTDPQSFPTKPRSWIFFWKIWIGDFMPWTLAIPSTLWLFWHYRAKLSPRLRDGAWLAITMIFIVLGFFSFSAYKLPHYILPVYAPLAWLLGISACWLFPQGHRGHQLWLFRVIGGLFVILGLLGLVFLDRLLPVWEHPMRFAPPVTFIAGGSWVFVFAGRRLLPWAASALTLAAAYVSIAAFTLPFQVEQVRPMKPLALAIAPQLRPQDRLITFRLVSQSITYYTHHKTLAIWDEEELLRQLSAPGRVFLFVRQAEFEQLPKWEIPFDIIGQRPEAFFRLDNLTGSAAEQKRRRVLVIKFGL